MIVTCDTDPTKGLLFTDRYGRLYMDSNRDWSSWAIRVLTSFFGFRNYDLKKVIECFQTHGSEQNKNVLREKYTYHLAKKHSICRADAQVLMQVSHALESTAILSDAKNCRFEELAQRKDKAIYTKVKELQKAANLATTSISSKAIDLFLLYWRVEQKYQRYLNLNETLQSEKISRFTPSEFRDFEDIANASEDLKKIAAFDPKIDAILRISQLARTHLDTLWADIARTTPPKSRLIVYSIDMANQYGHWRVPKIAQWISRHIYHSENIHLALSVCQGTHSFVSDLSLTHRFKSLRAGDYLYNMYDLHWDELVVKEKHKLLRSLFGDFWQEHLQEIFDDKMSAFHEEKTRFLSLENSIFHIIARMLMPCGQPCDQNQVPKLEKMMTCSCFVECILAHVLTEVDTHLKEKFLTQDAFITIPVSKQTPHNDLPHQMMQTWSKALTRVSTPAPLLPVRAAQS